MCGGSLGDGVRQSTASPPSISRRALDCPQHLPLLLRPARSSEARRKEEAPVTRKELALVETGCKENKLFSQEAPYSLT